MHTEPRAPPAKASYEAVPGRRGGPDPPETLREHGERAGWDVPVGRRGHHLFDDSDFSWRQSVRRHPRTGRLVVEGTRVLPLPSMEPARRQPKDPQERPEWNARAGLIDGAQDLPLGAAVWQPLPRQGESGGSVDGEHEPKQRRELLDASPEHKDLMPEFHVRAGGHVKTDDDRGRPAEPSACRRTGDTEIRRQGHISGAVDEIS